jgi:hypothetical protein
MKLISISAVAVSFVAQTANAASVSARFEPSEISMDGSAQLIIDASGLGRAEEAAPIAVDGLLLRRMPTIYRTSPSGAVTSTITHAVKAQRVGIHRLDSAALRVGDEFVPVPSAQLTVLSASDAAFKGGRLTDRLRQMQLFVEGLPSKIYVGQTFPVEIVLPIPPPVRIRTKGELPTKIGEGFRVGTAGDMPTEKFILLSQQRPDEVRWRTLLTATAAGSYTLAFAVGFEAADGENLMSDGSTAKRLGSIFSAEQWTPLAVYSMRHCGVVLQPTEVGKPESFSGAVGTFKLGEWRLRPMAGSTAEFCVSIVGHGNFGSLAVPDLSASGGCRVLRKSRSLLDYDDKLGHGGSIEFRYVISTEDGSPLPTFLFPFFNPETGSYEQLECHPD